MSVLCLYSAKFSTIDLILFFIINLVTNNPLLSSFLLSTCYVIFFLHKLLSFCIVWRKRIEKENDGF